MRRGNLVTAALLPIDAASEETRLSVPEESAKRRQILDGARRVFLAEGFDGASMNEVARTAAVSKGTLYVYFTNKEDLFAALIREEKQAQAEQLCRFDSDEDDVRSNLHGLGVKLLRLMLRPDSIAHLRTVMAVVAKFPNVGRAFYESGPLFGRRRLAEYLDRQVAAGHLAIDDTELAAAQFLELCKARYYIEATLGVAPPPGSAALDHHIGQAVDTFLRAYAPLSG